MKLLWITDECPYPPNTGGRVGIWKRIEYLSKNNEIILYSISDNYEDNSYLADMLRYCKEVVLFKRNNKINVLKKILFYPYPAISRWPKKMTNKITETCLKINPDFVIVDGPYMIGVIPREIRKKYTLILNQHNIEFLAYKSIGMKTNNIIKKIAFLLTSFQMKRYEKKVYTESTIDLYTFVSSYDKEFFEKEYFLNNTLLVPVGAEINISDLKKNCHNIIFVAKMSYQSNEDGALWLLDKIWDKIISEVEDAKLYLVGKDPSKKLIEHASKHLNVAVTGTVDDLSFFYNNTNVVVVPILAGGGVKVKLLEALGKGKYVITTTKGLEGTDFRNNVHLFACDNETEFANKCINALLYPDSISYIRNNAIEYMKERYSWEYIVDEFEKELLNLKRGKENGKIIDNCSSPR